MGKREAKKEERRRKKKERKEERRRKRKEKLVLPWCCRQEPQVRASVLHFSKVFLYEILMLSTIFRCGEFENVKKRFYFARKR